MQPSEPQGTPGGQQPSTTPPPAASQNLLQQGVADQFLGRVFGGYEAVQGVLLLVGMGLAAGLADAVGARLLLDLAGVLFLAAGALAFVRLRRSMPVTPAAPGAP